MFTIEDLEKIKIGNQSLATIYKNHRKWLRAEGTNWRTKRANVEQVTIENWDLSKFDLVRAGFTQVTFKNVILDCACFQRCDFKDCVFEDCILDWANFRGSHFESCTFMGKKSSMFKTDFSWSDMIEAKFYDVRLEKAYFDKVRYDSVIFDESVEGKPNIPLHCPEEGAFIGFKKAYGKSFGDEFIVVLQIPEKAKRSSAYSNKCRCSEAKVIRIEDMHGNVMPDNLVTYSAHCPSFTYKKGKTVRPKGAKYDPDRFHECSAGIHFFMSRGEAMDY